MKDTKPHIKICPDSARIVSITSDIVQKAQSENRSYLLENESKAILEAYGIKTTGAEVASTEDDAVEMALHLGYPVVLKVLSKTVVHKTDAGGVKLGLKDEVNVGRPIGRLPPLSPAKR